MSTQAQRGGGVVAELQLQTIPNTALERSGDQSKENEVGGVCGTYGGFERCIQGFGGET